MYLNGAHLAALNPLSSSSLLISLGALGVFLALFAETGLLIGFFLPGDSLLFTAGLFCTTSSAHKAHLRYGYGKAIVLARFIPVMRTVLNPLAGALQVPTRTFTIWQAVGGIVWSAGVTLAGYALGSTIPGIDTYLLPVIAVIVVVSGIPIVIELRRTRTAARADGRTADGAPANGPPSDRAPADREVPPRDRH